VGDRAAYAAQGAASAVTLRTCGAASPDTSVAKLAMTDRETLSFKLLKDQAFK
jgi:hypothetical protein